MRPPAHKSAHFSVHWAFVVQFQSDTAVEQGRLAGRVEHVVSGQATDFQSLETLLAFMAQVLRAERERRQPQSVIDVRGAIGREASNLQMASWSLCGGDLVSWAEWLRYQAVIGWPVRPNPRSGGLHALGDEERR